MGLFDNIEELENKEGLANVENIVIEEIKDWICKYYSLFSSRSDIRDALNIDTSTCPYIVSCKGAVILDAFKIAKNSDFGQELTDGRFVWGEVVGFICSGTPIKSLKGSPKKVDGDFGCAYCSELTSLEGAPEEVYGNFVCTTCKSLTTLNGAPREVSGDFNCSYCHSLTSLEGAPEEVGGNFDCEYCKNLKTLEGAPKVINVDFICNNCPSLETLKGAPEKVGNLLACECLKLKYISCGPEEVYYTKMVAGSYNVKDLDEAIIKYENQLYY